MFLSLILLMWIPPILLKKKHTVLVGIRVLLDLLARIIVFSIFLGCIHCVGLDLFELIILLKV